MSDSGDINSVKLPMKFRINALLWFLQRVTGIFIIFWMLLHTFTNYLIIQGKEAYEHEVIFYHELVPQIDILYAMLGLLIAWHAFYGVTNIVRDLSVRGTANKKPADRERPLLPTEASSASNVMLWFRAKRQLPTRPLWSIHRVSAMIILVTVLIHFTWIHLIGGFEYYSSWDFVIATFKDPAFMLFYLVFDFGISFHGTQGIRIILTDFTKLGEKPEYQKLVVSISLLLGIIGFLILAYIDLTAFLYVQFMR